MTLVRTLTIGEVLNELKDEFADITISKIRFLEAEGLIRPERTESGYRKFTPQDVERLRYVLRTQRDRYLPLKVIREELDRIDAGQPAELAPQPPATLAGTGASTPGPDDEAEAAPMDDVSPVPDGAAAQASRSGVEDATSRAPAGDEGSTGASGGRGGARAVSSLDDPPDEVSLSISELVEASGLPATTLRGLQEHGIIRDADRFDADDLRLARTSADLLAIGLEPRHLRMYRQFAERESAFYEQMISPLLRQRNPDSRRRARERIGDLVGAGETLHRQLLIRELRSLVGR